MRLFISFLFFFNDTATTEIYTLSLHDALPIFGEFRSQSHVLHGGGHDLSLDREEPAALLDRLVEAVAELAERREDQVAEAVPRRLGFAVEPKVEEPGEHGIAVGQGDETVADVAG